MPALVKHVVVGNRIERIGHSQPSDPTFVLDGIGPAQFRAHYLLLSNGVVLDLFTAELTLSTIDKMVSVGQTDGIPVADLIGRTITDVWNDDTSSCILILDQEIYLKDANDGCYGNPLHAGYVVEDYDESERAQFTDYWTDEPVNS